MSENSQHGKPLQQEWQEYNDRQGQKTQHRQNSEQERNGRYSPNQCFFFAVLTLIILIPFLLGIVPLFLMRWRLNILSLGDDDVKCLGIDVRNLRLIVIGCSTLLTASCVSVAGIIGWVGLIVPHIARMLVGSNFIALLPGSALIGATYLLLIDDAARGIFKAEIPLSILTALIGAPYFIYLLVKTKDAT